MPDPLPAVPFHTSPTLSARASRPLPPPSSCARLPEYMSLYVDSKLQSKAHDLGDEEAERMCDDILTLFDYLADKDVFEKYYKQHLAKVCVAPAPDDSRVCCGPQERGQLWSANFRNFSAIALCFSTFLLVPCVSPVQKCCSLRLREVWLRHRKFPSFFLNFPAIFCNWI